MLEDFDLVRSAGVEAPTRLVDMAPRQHVNKGGSKCEGQTCPQLLFPCVFVTEYQVVRSEVK